MNSKNASASGIGLDVILFMVFLVLKLCNVINWSWWWVTAPLWIPITLCVAVCIVLFIVGVFIGIIRACIKHREERNGK